MGTTLSKAQLVSELKQENADWEALLDAIGEANMTQPEVAGGWSIKDIVAHLTEWRRRTVKRFQSIRNPEVDLTPHWPKELQEDDEINAWIYKANRDRPLTDVLSDSREVIQQLIAAIDALSDENLHDPRIVAWLDGDQLTGKVFFGHFHDEHEADMRAWLDR
jgi:hypothetical protein